MALSIDSVDDVAKMRESAGASFEFFSDPEGSLLDPLEIRHAGARFDGVDLPQSASFLVAPDGTLLWQKLAETYRARPAPDEILKAIDSALPAS